MELEEIKKRWAELDTRLAKTQMTNERIVREMITQRSSRSLANLINSEVIGALILILAIVFCALVPHWINVHAFTRSFLYSLIPVNGLIIIWQIIKASLLVKIDTSGAMVDNIRRINRYKLFIKHEKVAFIVALQPVLIALVIINYVSVGIPLIFWMLAAVVLGGVIALSLFSYKRFYAKNIESIRGSLEELRDLEK